MPITPQHPANHKGAIVRWPVLRFPESPLGEIKKGERNEILRWEEDILLEPMDYQILLTFFHGGLVLPAEVAKLVELEDVNMWDDECERRQKEIYEKYHNNHEAKASE